MIGWKVKRSSSVQLEDWSSREHLKPPYLPPQQNRLWKRVVANGLQQSSNCAVTGNNILLRKYSTLRIQRARPCHKLCTFLCGNFVCSDVIRMELQCRHKQKSVRLLQAFVLSLAITWNIKNVSGTLNGTETPMNNSGPQFMDFR